MRSDVTIKILAGCFLRLKCLLFQLTNFINGHTTYKLILEPHVVMRDPRQKRLNVLNGGRVFVWTLNFNDD